VIGAAGPRVVVLDYGIGNLRSAARALVRVGARAELVTEPGAVRGADGVVLPGVGAFGRCAAALAETGLGPAALAAIEAGVPFLGICVGLQLLYDRSEEEPGARGLGVLPGTVMALDPSVKRPQMQWNRLERRPGAASGLLAGLELTPWVYFVHSYAPEETAATVATCEYGGRIVAAVETGAVWGTQFHPEKSGTVGLEILGNFVAAAAGARAA
jgi:glutamine amidotransferase